MSSLREKSYAYEPTIEIYGHPAAHLRYPRTSDAKEAFEQLMQNTDYLIERGESWAGTIKSTSHMERLIDCWIQNAARGLTMPYWLIEGSVRPSGPILGALMLDFHDKENRRAMASCWIAENQQGQGIVSRGGQTIFDYARRPDVWGLQQVVAHISVDNLQSQQRAQDAGFQTSGELFRLVVPDGYCQPAGNPIVQEWIKQL